MALDRPVRYGMVGVGPDAFIGAVHRSAAAPDGEMELVAGPFSSNPGESRQHGAEEPLRRVRDFDFPPADTGFEEAFPEE